MYRKQFCVLIELLNVALNSSSSVMQFVDLKFKSCPVRQDLLVSVCEVVDNICHGEIFFKNFP